MEKIDIYFDGACWNKADDDNPIMGIGVAVFIDGIYDPIFSTAENYMDPFIRGTNNIAEWRGAVVAMGTACDLANHVYCGSDITIYSDSQIIARQFNGEYAIKEASFQSFCDASRFYAEQAGIKGIKRIEWIPREMNKHADILSKIGRKHMERNTTQYNIEIELNTIVSKRGTKEKLISSKVQENGLNQIFEL